jgi:hypothetical protein
MARVSAPAVLEAVHDLPASRQIYEEGLAAAARVYDNALAPSTIAKQEEAGRDLSAWLATQPHARGLRTCTGSDLLAICRLAGCPVAG